jgi:hypothetical protein
MRGRPTNNRRGPNPLTRSYESNGPDVKIRGNAHHVAEKYLQLARDAHTSGDPVAAENYLQHAEHYFRLIAAAQAAQLAAQNGRPPGEGDYDDSEDDEDGGVLADRFASPSERQQQNVYGAPQPPFTPQPPVVNGPAPFAYVERQPFEPERPQPQERQNFQPRQDRRDGRPERGPRPDRPFADRQEGRREFRPYRDPSQREQPAPEGAPAAALPSFITAGPRLTNPADESEQPAPPPEVAVVEGSEPAEALPPRADHDQPQPDGRFPRGRRRRLRSPYGLYAQGNAEEGQTPPLPPEDTPVSE